MSLELALDSLDTLEFYALYSFSALTTTSRLRVSQRLSAPGPGSTPPLIGSADASSILATISGGYVRRVARPHAWMLPNGWSWKTPNAVNADANLPESNSLFHLG